MPNLTYRSVPVRASVMVVLWGAVFALLTACQPAESTPTEAFTRQPSLQPSATVLPLASGAPSDEFLGRSNPTQAGLAAEGELPDGTVSPPVLATEPSVPLQIFAGDGVLLQVAFYGQAVDDAPLVILLHDENESGASWDAFARQLREQGYAVLVPDLRGHGRSGGQADWQQALQDMQAILNNLPAQGINAARPSMVVGVGRGGNLGLVLCAQTVSCRAGVLVSPRPPQDLDVYNAASALGERTLLLVSADDDPAGTQEAQQLSSRASGQAQWQRYSSGGQGGALFGTQLDLSDVILRWLQDQLPT